jgi:hypothetical protein
MEKYADKLLKGKIVGPSRSAWNAPTNLIKKAGFNKENAADPSQWRLCPDFRKLNQKVHQEFIPLINKSSMSHDVEGYSARSRSRRKR